jgi:osmotically-inducible protein OsmY
MRNIKNPKTVNSTLANLISLKIKKEFVNKGFRKLYAKIHVEVVQGRVLLTGDVENEEHVISAVEISWSVPGVKEVINELKISETSDKFNATQSFGGV